MLKKSRRLNVNNVKSVSHNLILVSFIPIILVIIWEVLGSKGIINRSIMPAPSRIYKTFEEMIFNGELKRHLLISTIRVVEGFGIGSIAGILIGVLMGLFNNIDKSLTFLVGVLRPIPIIAWIPIFILWMGIDNGSKIAVIALGSFWPVLINTIHGIKSADNKLLEVATILEKSKFQILAKVIFPCALPSIFTGIRLGIGSAWMSVVAAEMIAAATGIGYLIMYARELSQPDVMLVGVVSIGIIGLLIDYLIRKLQNKVLKWNLAKKL
ncbi:ABC transporter permease [Clostridium sp. LP20]|uniref:ABC transporter permease n=1 Tax=Clostridium sp. LP20 TaxID=3418665 RepID=UPI003EE7EF79